MRSKPPIDKPSRLQLLMLGATAVAGAAVYLVRDDERREKYTSIVNSAAQGVAANTPNLAPSSSHVIKEAQKRLAEPDSLSKVVAVCATAALGAGLLGYLAFRGQGGVRPVRRTVADANVEQTEEALEASTVAELRKQASQQEIKGRSSMNKQELVESLAQDSSPG